MISVHFAYAQTLPVMTYNIRLDHTGDGVNQWENRKADLVKQVLFYEPVIMGIQEGLPNQVTYLDEQLEGYAFVGVGREDGKDKGEFSAIYYKTKKVELVTQGTFWLSETPEKPSVGWDAALPRVCTYARFKLDKSEKQFWVFNTHFDHMGEQARLESMKLIHRKIIELNTETLPVILMGDLNAEPDKLPVIEMKKSLRDSRDAAELIFGPEATFNGFDFETIPTRLIDYIAVSPEWKVKKYAVLTDSKEKRYYSDHFAVLAELKFD